jgi:hypothetical protein
MFPPHPAVGVRTDNQSEETMAAKKTQNGEGATERKRINLELPPGEWWRPWEDGDLELQVTLQRLKTGSFGEYFVGVDGENNTWFINAHAMLFNLRAMMGRTVLIRYLGKDETKGRNGTHMYEAELVQRTRGRGGRNAGSAATNQGDE